EAQQCVKLTGTNSSIGLIVLIVHAHRRSIAALMMLIFCPDAPKRSGRAAPSGATASGLAEIRSETPGQRSKTCSQN
ncbi:hypothetical protein, partial [Shinella sp. JR1-6]|uniref:hypothetical protein n=1 Tax=Shinella sp. JR1-6 TaxID=2527671 RepID=UPI001A9DBAD3